MGKFPLYTAIFSLLIIITAFVCLNTNNINYNEENIAIPEIMTNKEKDKGPNGAEFANNEEENTPASTAVQKIESYIVKYDGEEVML